jgi:hypothetical protein
MSTFPPLTPDLARAIAAEKYRDSLQAERDALEDAIGASLEVADEQIDGTYVPDEVIAVRYVRRIEKELGDLRALITADRLAVALQGRHILVDRVAKDGNQIVEFGVLAVPARPHDLAVQLLTAIDPSLTDDTAGIEVTS